MSRWGTEAPSQVDLTSTPLLCSPLHLAEPLLVRFVVVVFAIDVVKVRVMLRLLAYPLLSSSFSERSCSPLHPPSPLPSRACLNLACCVEKSEVFHLPSAQFLALAIAA